MPRYADILLPLAQPTYSFSVPEGVEIGVGDAVAVQFGPRNTYTGIVWRLHDRRPDVKRVKSIGRRLYDYPLVDEAQMRLWEWMAEYYMCSLGEVMRMALPSMIKPQGSSEEDFRAEEFQPRKESYLGLAPQWQDRAALKAECERIARRAPRRKALLEAIADFPKESLNSYGEMPRRLVDCDSAMLAALRKAGYISVVERERSVEQVREKMFRLPELTTQQATALSQIEQSWGQGRNVHLLHGITGSGKTEVYIHLIAKALSEEKDVLLLLPEIALTSQLIERLERVFGSRVTAYHSKLSNLRRTEIYLRMMRSRGGELVVGARSALFLPFKRLGVVVVDEEHDSSYKQSDTAPRYNGRDCATILASMHGAKTLLSSATPSLESYANSQWGKYGYSRLTERYGEARPPRIILSETMRSVKRGERKAHFNQPLLRAISEALERGEQVMLFQNRRGFSPYVGCKECGWTLRCPNCNVTLTMHRGKNRMECHYCGHSEEIPRVCPQCKRADIHTMGFGTERVEEAISEIFPEARVVRLDRDTSTSMSAYNRIIKSFESGETDILVGTQMITKGFDFGRVSVVGILNADNMISSPDFRSSERAFQLMTQVAGRAGRREREGVVVVQSSEVDNPVIGWVLRGDYEAMARSELQERHAFAYPPYSHIVQFTMRHEDPRLLLGGATNFAQLLRDSFGRRVIGPVAPPIDRIRGVYALRIMIKIESGRSMAKARELIRKALAQIAEQKSYKPISIAIDVDPQ